MTGYVSHHELLPAAPKYMYYAKQDPVKRKFPNPRADGILIRKQQQQQQNFSATVSLS